MHPLSELCSTCFSFVFFPASDFHLLLPSSLSSLASSSSSLSSSSLKKVALGMPNPYDFFSPCLLHSFVFRLITVEANAREGGKESERERARASDEEEEKEKEEEDDD